MIERLFERIAPEETAAERALPLTLLVRPWPILSLVVLAVNDHLLKGSGLLPGLVTGKLSDFAGLLFFPLLLVTLWDLALAAANAVLRRQVFLASPTSQQLIVACLATGAFFSAVQIHPPVAELYARGTAFLAFWSDAPLAQVAMDPTDLVAVPVVVASFFLGQREIAKLPPGRIPFLRERLFCLGSEKAREIFARSHLQDVRAAAPKERRKYVDEIAAALAEGGTDAELDALLKRLRGQAEVL